jgi:transcriptional regulator with XRE-family HTH domain
MSGAEVLRAKRRVRRLAKDGRLEELFEENGWTKSDVARYLGVNPAQVSRWTRDLQGIRGENAIALVELLDGEGE